MSFTKGFRDELRHVGTATFAGPALVELLDWADAAESALAKNDGSWERLGRESIKVAIEALWTDHPEIAYESPAQVIRWLQSELATATDRATDAESKLAVRPDLAQLAAAYRKSLEPFVAEADKWNHRSADAYDGCCAIKYYRDARATLQSHDPGAALLAEHAAELAKERSRADENFKRRPAALDAEFAALRQRAEAAEAKLAARPDLEAIARQAKRIRELESEVIRLKGEVEAKDASIDEWKTTAVKYQNAYNASGWWNA